MYQLTALGYKDLETGTEIPAAEGNADYEVVKDWLAAGNTPLPMAPVDWAGPVWELFRDRRDTYLARLSDIAGRYQRKGDTVVPPAADAIAEGVLAIPQSLALQDPAIDTAEKLQTAIVIATNNLVKAQLTNPATATTIKAALDKVFK